MNLIRKLYKLIDIENLSDSTYVLKFERNDLMFIPGQNIIIGFNNESESRPYSIFSGLNDNYIEVLIKDVQDGNLSKRFRKVSPGDSLLLSEPFGGFIIENDIIENIHHYFIATGTAISPFHSIITSYENLYFTLIHGIRYENEQYRKEKYINGKYLTCITKSENGSFHGRVNDFIKETDLIENSKFHICGSYSMIDNVYDVLLEKGISKNQIVTEGYF
jgi:ferredoxin--NADP+ reductase/benzoate/toluate 1,2-dioxygenase reductase subunit